MVAVVWSHALSNVTSTRLFIRSCGSTWAASGGRGGTVWTERSRSPRGCARAPSSRPALALTVTSPRGPHTHTPHTAYGHATFFFLHLNWIVIQPMSLLHITCSARRVFISSINCHKCNVSSLLLHVNIPFVYKEVINPDYLYLANFKHLCLFSLLCKCLNSTVREGFIDSFLLRVFRLYELSLP